MLADEFNFAVELISVGLGNTAGMKTVIVKRAIDKSYPRITTITETGNTVKTLKYLSCLLILLTSIDGAAAG